MHQGSMPWDPHSPAIPSSCSVRRNAQPFLPQQGSTTSQTISKKSSIPKIQGSTGSWQVAPHGATERNFQSKRGRSKEVTFSYTVHGPIVKMDEAKGIAYSKQLSCKEDYLSGFVSFYELMKAKP